LLIAAQRYVINSSAVVNSVSGMVKPSVLAVLRAVTRLNLVGCCIQKSASLVLPRVCAVRRDQKRVQRRHASGTANPDTKYDGWFGCHKSQESQDFLFTYDRLKAASRRAKRPATVSQESQDYLFTYDRLKAASR
jgi:hypothetical protein